MTDSVILIFVALIFLLALYFVYTDVIRPMYRRADWKQSVQYDYFKEINHKRLHQVHFNKMKEWIITEGEKWYITSPSLVHQYFIKALESTEIETIKELKDKFLNEHKSRNTKDTPAV